MIKFKYIKSIIQYNELNLHNFNVYLYRFERNYSSNITSGEFLPAVNKLYFF